MSAQPEPDFTGFDVSRETREKLRHYQRLLEKWQGALNLVSRASLADSWQRHFVDSMQLSGYIPKDAKTLFDFGSGAGFPGMVLAILNPEMEVSLVESDHRKCTFLSTVSRETQTPVTIINQRIEALETKSVPDIITARALAPLSDLCGYALPWAEKNPLLYLLFLKGEKAKQEITDAKERYDFECRLHESQTDSSGHIIEATNLCKKSEL